MSESARQPPLRNDADDAASAAKSGASLALSKSSAELRARILADLREKWQRGDKVPVESYVRLEPKLRDDEEAFLDLVYAEYVVRLELGESPNLEEYAARFPQFAARLERLFTLDRGLLADSAKQNTTVSARRPVQIEPPADHPAAIGKYRIIQRLAAGGQGAVYRAVHPSLAKDVVIKLSSRPCPAASAEREAFLAEGRILAELDHPCLARIYDLDFHKDRAYLVMEYIRGSTLDQYARQEPFSPAEAARMVARVARALAVAHEHGIIHRDLKPRNILVDETGQPRIIDFGLARVEQAWMHVTEEPGTISGTLQFMAPEQARGDTDRIDPRTDVFALGGVLFHLLTGQAPFAGADSMAVLAQARAGAVNFEALDRTAAPARLKAICRKALALNPADRYPGAKAFAADLEAVVRPRKVWPWAAAATLLLVAGAASLAWALGWWNPARETNRGRAIDLPKPSLAIQVRDRRLGFVDVVGRSLSLRSGDKVQFVAEPPPGLHVSLFLFTSEGNLRLLAQRPPGTTLEVFRYPDKEGYGVELKGPPGTEIIFLCCRRDGPIAADDVASRWDGPKPWPALPEYAVWRLRPDKVELISQPRDVGPPEELAQETIQARLQAIRQRFAEHFDYFEGLAYSLQD